MDGSRITVDGGGGGGDRVVVVDYGDALAAAMAHCLIGQKVKESDGGERSETTRRELKKIKKNEATSVGTVDVDKETKKK